MRLFDLKHPQVELSDTISYISQLDFVKVKTKYAFDGWSALSLQGFGELIINYFKEHKVV